MSAIADGKLGGIALTDLALFRGLQPEDAAVLFAACSEKTLVAGEDLFSEGDIGGSIWTVKSGKAEVYARLTGGVEQTLEALVPGDSIGEVTFVEPATRSASARTTEASEFLVLTPEAFAAIQRDRPSIAAKFYANLARLVATRLRNTTEHYRQVMDAHIEAMGASRLNLRALSEELRMVAVGLTNGSTIEGNLLLVDHHAAGYSLVVKASDGPMKMIPYHAVMWVQPIKGT